MKEIYHVETVVYLPKENENQSSEFQLPDEEKALWTMDFDGAVGKEGVGIGIWIRIPMNHLGNIAYDVRV